MSEKELEIFNLCQRLAELLGDKEAIADLKELYDRHPEMFKDMQEVSHTIKEVVSEPDLIMKNPKAETEKDFIVAKQTLNINNKKMGDIGISNKNGVNGIFHANKQDKRNFNRFVNRINKTKVVSSEAVHSLHTPSQTWMGGNDKSSGVNTLLETTQNTISQNKIKSQENLKLENGTNEIFHANQKKMKELIRFKKNLPSEKNLVGGGDAHSPHPDSDKNQNQVRATDISSMCSPTSRDIIPQKPNFNTKNFEKLSIEEKLEILTNNQNFLQNQKRASEVLQDKNTQNQDNENLENLNKEKNTIKRRR